MTSEPSPKKIKYHKEIFREEYDMTYPAAKAYQAQVVKILKEIFGDDMVKSEWDSVEYDGHTGNHSQVYAPRIDIAVGPFNSYMDLDIGNDRTAVMKNHPLVKKLQENVTIEWNDLARCFLAIEIVFSGTTKYIAGDFLNSTATGAIGFVVAHKKVYGKVRRMKNYFHRLDDFERLGKNGLQNLMVFQDEDFLEFLWELKNPDKLPKLEVSTEYPITFKKGMFSKTFSVHAHATRYKPDLGTSGAKELSAYGFDVTEVLSEHNVVLTTTRYTSPSNVQIYEIVTPDNKRIKFMDVIDVVVREKYRNRGIGTQMLEILEKIARENKCQYVCVQLGYDNRNTPVEAQKHFFEKNGFQIWSDKRARFSGWVGKKSLI